jgi:hypothetical protein
VPDVVDQLKQFKRRAADAAGTVRDGAGGAVEQVKQKAADVTRAITNTLRDEAERLFDEQKGKAASKVGRYGKMIHQVAHALRAVKADPVAELVDSAGGRVEGLTDYLEERNLAQVLEDAGEVARRHPGMMIGGMFLTGLALARFLKASESRQEDEGGDDSGEEGGGEESDRAERPRSGAASRGGASRRR